MEELSKEKIIEIEDKIMKNLDLSKFKNRSEIV